MYFYLGNCLTEEECTKGTIEGIVNKCQCIDWPKCYYCSSESLSNGNLCESCNIGYHKKS